MSIKRMVGIWDKAREFAGVELLALIALADWADDDGVTNYAPSIPGGPGGLVGALAWRLRCSERTARRLISELQAAGAIERLDSGIGRGNRPRWRLCVGLDENRTMLAVKPDNVGRENRTKLADCRGRSL